ncbi:MAG TPA: SdpI family protein [Bacteroidota bacterium]|nr:SdpI family protein [Bacteroidota bacterium]
MKYRALIFWSIVAVTLLLSALAWDRIPDTMESHWNVRGEADDTIPKFWGLFLMPMVLAAMVLLALLIPRIDPLKQNIALFRKYYDGFMLMVLLFMVVVHIFLILWNMGTRISPNAIFPPALAVLFYAIGVLCGAAKRNWFIGIRTPWTLSSDAVWEKTHRKARVLFKVAAFLILAGALLGEYTGYAVLVTIIGLVFYLVIYSYLEYRREQQSHP